MIDSLEKGRTQDVAAPVVLVTGASRGIGRAIAVHAARDGWSVAVNYRENREAAEETLRLCGSERRSPTQKFTAHAADVGSDNEREALIQSVAEAHDRIDALVNNAGAAPTVRRDILETTPSSFRRVMETNLLGPFFLMQAAARFWLSGTMQPRGPSGFVIVNISSISAEAASLNRGEYCVSKAGLSMASTLWALRVAEFGISVCELRPGIIATDMTVGVRERYDALIAEGVVPAKRWGTPDDVAAVCLAILGGRLPFTTGAVIHVDGGLHIRRL
ncbi:MAG: 3-ketoacyl-ACP reductase [Bacteroidota bacterium]|nr:3-ketoacyl-ACP reductase [Bacteroidota bacterium]